MIGWRDPSFYVTRRARLTYTQGMNALDHARAVIAASNARRVKTDILGGIIVHPVSTHLLARRAVCEWWDAK